MLVGLGWEFRSPRHPKLYHLPKRHYLSSHNIDVISAIQIHAQLVTLAKKSHILNRTQIASSSCTPWSSSVSGTDYQRNQNEIPNFCITYIPQYPNQDTTLLSSPNKNQHYLPRITSHLHPPYPKLKLKKNMTIARVKIHILPL